MKNKKAILKIHYEKQGGRWVEIDREFYNEFMPDGITKTWDNITSKDNKRFFRNLGGTETTVKNKHISINPDKTRKSEYIKQ